MRVRSIRSAITCWTSRGLYAAMLLWVVIAGYPLGAGGQERPDSGAQLYVDQYSVCHGVIAPVSRSMLEPTSPRTLASAPMLAGGSEHPRHRGAARADAPARLRLDARGHRAAVRPGARRSDRPPGGSRQRLQLLPSIPGDPAGVVWKRQTLDRWFVDSQLWVPSSIMFYKQPDAAVRAKIIDYLEGHR